MSWQMSQNKLQEQVKEMSEVIARLTESNNNLVQNQQLAMMAIRELTDRVKELEVRLNNDCLTRETQKGKI